MLCRREGVWTGEEITARSCARGLELVAGAAGEEVHAAAPCQVERAAEGLAGVAAPVGPAQRGAEVDQRSGVLELGWGLGEELDGLFEEAEALGSGRGTSERSECGGASGWRADAFGEV